MSVLIIAPWGHPEKWGEANYVIDGVIVKNKCSTIALLTYAIKVKHCEVEDVKVLVVIADTLSASNIANGIRYREVIEKASKIAQDKLKEFLDIVEAQIGVSSKELERQFEIFVAPGLGKFGAFTFRGSFDLYYLVFLLKSLSKTYETYKHGFLEIWLDITHGVNYMPVLAFTAMLDTLWALKSCGYNISLRVYNSDPYVGRGEQLNINEMPYTTVPRTIPQPKLGEGPAKILEQPHIILAKGYHSLVENTYFKRLSEGELRNLVVDLWYAVYYNYPLILLDYVFRKYKEETLKQLIELADKVPEDILRIIINALYKLRVTNNIVNTKSILRNSTSKYRFKVADIAQFLVVINTVSYMLDKAMNFKKESRPISLKDIEEFARRFNEKYNTLAPKFISREVHSLVKSSKGIKELNKWVRYTKEMAQKISSIEVENGEREKLSKCTYVRYVNEFVNKGVYDRRKDDRNFIAHSGLTYNDIEIMKIS